MNVSPHIKRMNKGRPPKYPELEKAIFGWVQELCSKLKPVTRAMVQIGPQIILIELICHFCDNKYVNFYRSNMLLNYNFN